MAIEIPTQSAITQDNVALAIDGVLYYRVVEPYKACYGVEDADFAITQLAQTTMRSEIGKLSLDRTLAERNLLNVSIVEAINEAAIHWGIRCLRYEIRDIQPPESVVKAMHSQVSAERQKRALILESEGSRQSAINVAEGQKQSRILASEGLKAEKINQAVGEAEAIVAKANATAVSIEAISQAIASHGQSAVSLMVAEKYIEAFSQIAQKSTTMLLPSNTSDPASLVAQAMSIFKKVSPSGSDKVAIGLPIGGLNPDSSGVKVPPN